MTAVTVGAYCVRPESCVQGKIRPINTQNRQLEAKMNTYKNLLSASELKTLLEKDRCCVVDCRFDLMQPSKGQADYLQSHIEGAVYAHLDHDLAAPISAESGRHPLPSMHAFQELLNSWGVGSDTQVVVYDYSNGATAARLWWMLRWVGHTNVAVLDGGYAAWLAANNPVDNVIPSIKPVAREFSANMAMVITADEILAAQSSGTVTLVDARDKTRFDGISEPIDTKAGHVPGALNLPFPETLQSDGRWKPVEELRAIWTDAIRVQEGRPLATMCGSGVTACHLILTAELLGKPLPRLYVGSWSEWIRDSSRAIATSDQR